LTSSTYSPNAATDASTRQAQYVRRDEDLAVAAGSRTATDHRDLRSLGDDLGDLGRRAFNKQRPGAGADHLLGEADQLHSPATDHRNLRSLGDDLGDLGRRAFNKQRPGARADHLLGEADQLHGHLRRSRFGAEAADRADPLRPNADVRHHCNARVADGPDRSQVSFRGLDLDHLGARLGEKTSGVAILTIWAPASVRKRPALRIASPAFTW